MSLPLVVALATGCGGGGGGAMGDDMPEPDPDDVVDAGVPDPDSGGEPTPDAGDETPPHLMLSPEGFFVDGGTWWTGAARPDLTGTVMDVNVVAVLARIGTSNIPGEITGDTFRIPLSGIDATGKDVIVVAMDVAGNETTLSRFIRYDATPPTLTLQNATMFDEASDRVTFASSADVTKHEVPQHQHGGASISLDASTCPTITKYSYLLGATPPANVVETPARNPIQYPVVIGDDGVGLALDSAEFRVVRRGTQPTVVRDWAAMPAGVPAGADALRHVVGLYSNEVTGLATTEGTYEVELRAKDLLGRATTLNRCFQLKLRAAPLHFTTSGVAQGHPLALDALSLDSSGTRDVSTRVLNPGGTGAGLVEQRFINGTTSPVYVTFDLTKPTLQAALRKFRRAAARTAVATVSDNCDVANPPAHCEAPAPRPPYSSALAGSGETAPFDVTVKVFETDAQGFMTTELPCNGCTATSSRFGFTVPPRAAGSAPRYFTALAMIAPRPELYPSDATYPSTPPYSEPVLAGVGFTGKQDPASIAYCSRYEFRGPEGDLAYCVQKTTYRYYHALESVELRFGSATAMSSATALNASHAATSTGMVAARGAGTWQRTQSVFPQ